MNVYPDVFSLFGEKKFGDIIYMLICTIGVDNCLLMCIYPKQRGLCGILFAGSDQFPISQIRKYRHSLQFSLQKRFQNRIRCFRGSIIYFGHADCRKKWVFVWIDYDECECADLVERSYILHESIANRDNEYNWVRLTCRISFGQLFPLTLSRSHRVR